MVCWNFSPRNLEFCKGSHVHGWLPKIVFSRSSQTMAERMCHCRVHSWDQDLSIYPTHRWVRLLRSRDMGLDATVPSKALLSMNRCQIFVVGGGQEDKNEGHLLLPWYWCQKLYNIIEGTHVLSKVTLILQSLGLDLSLESSTNSSTRFQY